MTTANIITMARVLMIPVFYVFAIKTGAVYEAVAIAIFIIASITDAIDGHIARKMHQVTNFGKFMDPLADKLLVMTALLIFVGQDIMPAWAAVIILAREFVVTSLRMVAAVDGVVIQASRWGKMKTLIHMLGISFLLLRLHPISLGGTITLQDLIILAMVLISVCSGINYVRKNVSVIKDGFTQRGS